MDQADYFAAVARLLGEPALDPALHKRADACRRLGWSPAGAAVHIRLHLAEQLEVA